MANARTNKDHRLQSAANLLQEVTGVPMAVSKKGQIVTDNYRPAQGSKDATRLKAAGTYVDELLRSFSNRTGIEFSWTTDRGKPDFLPFADPDDPKAEIVAREYFVASPDAPDFFDRVEAVAVEFRMLKRRDAGKPVDDTARNTILAAVKAELAGGGRKY